MFHGVPIITHSVKAVSKPWAVHPTFALAAAASAAPPCVTTAAAAAADSSSFSWKYSCSAMARV